MTQYTKAKGDVLRKSNSRIDKSLHPPSQRLWTAAAASETMSIVNNPERQKSMPFLKSTTSTREQLRTEAECAPFFADLSAFPESQLDQLRDTGLISKIDPSNLDICLLVEKHNKYLEKVWKRKEDDSPQLRGSFVSLDSSRTWMVYWSLHAADLMGHEVNKDDSVAIVETIKSCWTTVTIEFSNEQVNLDPLLRVNAEDALANETHTFSAGGFGGGPGQIPHAATSYAAVLVLCILASREPLALSYLEEIRIPLYAWFASLQERNGGFRMHHDGEIDVRATYCVVAVQRLLNISMPETENDLAAGYVARCQTWEGGFGGEPFAEAHGGYTFCSIAALKLLERTSVVDVEALGGYLTRRQMSLEGGFNGRANKLVDGCYSMWQGGALAITSAILVDNNTKDEDPWLSKVPPSLLLFDQCMLERYILLCAQDVNGGLRDKPSKHRDHYHSCYNISGLSIAQHWDKSTAFGHTSFSQVGCTHPCYNIRLDHVEFCLHHFGGAS